MLFVSRTDRAKGVMGFPIRCHMRTEEVFQLLYCFTFHKLAQSCLLLIVEVGELGNTDMREVLRTKPKVAPEMKVHRFHRELVGQIEIFIPQFGKVPLVKCQGLIIVGNRVKLQESCLSHKDRLYLEEVIAMMGYGRERNILRPHFEGIVVDAKAIVSGQSHEISILPRTTTLFYPSLDCFCLLFQPFSLQGSHP